VNPLLITLKETPRGGYEFVPDRALVWPEEKAIFWAMVAAYAAHMAGPVERIPLGCSLTLPTVAADNPNCTFTLMDTEGNVLYKKKVT